ncbi:ATP12 family protein [Methyloligella sp. 2.7D]|uniref:ATP12 family chaperone protein n=1 Tax=unclassified Methyloligella TaxID=2625955 RepID=UPI001ABB4AD2|nr:ATP12 family protein [Methyloligella sp. GL2]
MSGAKKFYETVSVEEVPSGGAEVLLDGKRVKTPKREPLAFPSTALAEAVAEEWRGQGETIDPGTMPLTRLANTAIDGVSAMEEAVLEDILNFAGTDLLCYRASGPDGLIAKQQEIWDPVLGWIAQRYGAEFALAEGVIHVEQPADSVVALRDALKGLDPFGLAALHVMTSLTGSALLALAVAEGEIGPEAAWEAAHVDEDWQIGLWGEDAEAAERREARRQDFAAAAKMLKLLRC